MKHLLIFAALLTSITAAAQKGYDVGDRATDFNLPNVITGKNVSMAGYDNAKGFIIAFTCNHCPYAVKNEDRLNALNAKYASKGYPVIAINPTDTVKYADNSYAAMKQRASEKSFSFPYLLDGSQSVGKAYGATKTPHLYVVQKKGADYIVKYIGAIDDSVDDASAVKERYVESAVDALIAGKDVAKKSTKAIGCGISYK